MDFLKAQLIAANNSQTSCAAVAQPLPNGCYTLKAKHSNKFIQPETANGGARLRQYNGNGQTAQIFSLEWVDNAAYRINSQSASRVVEAAGAGSGNGTPVVLGDWSGGSHQKWNLEAWGDGTYKLSPRNAPGKLFDVEGPSMNNGAGVHLWEQHGGDNQRFFVQSTGCSGTTEPPTGTCALSKIRIYPRKDCCAGRTIGGQVQYSTVGRNGPWVTAHTLSNEVANSYAEYGFGSVSSIKAVRYLSPNGGYGNVAEIEFYNGNTKLTGTQFDDGAGPWNGDPSRVAAKAMDGDVNTYYDSNNCCGAFVGLELNGCGGGGCAAPVPGISGGGNVCNGQTVTLTASGCGGTYRWSNGTNGVSSINVGGGTYSVACEQNGCTSASSAPVTVTANCGGGGGGCVVNRVRFKFRNAGDCCMDRLVGAKIQGSNDQNNWTDLYTFTASGTGSWQEQTFSNPTAYPYVRFLASSTGYGELFELEFYNGSTKLSGTAFGTSGVDGGTGYASAFDGNINTWWHGVFPGTGNYAGLNLGGCSGGRQAAEGAFPASPEAKGLLLVPNPATDYVELRLAGGEQARRATCYDALGRKLVETTESRMYVGRLTAGTYLIRVETTTGQAYGKMLVKP